MFGKKDKKLELVKEMLGTRAAYAETIKDLDLTEDEKTLFMRASSQVKKDNPNSAVITKVYGILIDKVIKKEAPIIGESMSDTSKKAFNKSSKIAKEIKNNIEENSPIVEENLKKISKRAFNESSKIAAAINKKGYDTSGAEFRKNEINSSDENNDMVLFSIAFFILPLIAGKASVLVLLFIGGILIIKSLLKNPTLLFIFLAIGVISYFFQLFSIVGTGLIAYLVWQRIDYVKTHIFLIIMGIILFLITGSLIFASRTGSLIFAPNQYIVTVAVVLGLFVFFVLNYTRKRGYRVKNALYIMITAPTVVSLFVSSFLNVWDAIFDSSSSTSSSVNNGIYVIDTPLSTDADMSAASNRGFVNHESSDFDNQEKGSESSEHITSEEMKMKFYDAEVGEKMFAHYNPDNLQEFYSSSTGGSMSIHIDKYTGNISYVDSEGYHEFHKSGFDNGQYIDPHSQNTIFMDKDSGNLILKTNNGFGIPVQFSPSNN